MITVIIPCRNERDHIGSLLKSLISQDCLEEWEAIVADGMSDDGTREILADVVRRDARIRVIDNPAGIVSTGLNQAIREARGEVILRMDSHTEYAPDYMSQCLRCLETSGADNVGGPMRSKSNGIVQSAVAAAFHSPFSTGGAKFHDAAYEGFVDTVYCGCWRKSTLEQIGLFDEFLVRNQDDELNLRLKRAGGKIWQSPGIVSWYRPRRSLTGLFRQYSQYGYWKVEVIRKHQLPASWRHLVPGAFVFGNGGALASAAMAELLGSHSLALLMLTTWLLGIGLYALACLAAAVHAARKYGWNLLPVLPLVFVIYHVSYGLGFLRNAVRGLRPHAGSSQPSAFTSVTR